MITQKDLLSEGFWNNFKGVVKGVGAVAKEIGKTVLPQTAKAIDDTANYGKKLKHAYIRNSNFDKFLKNFIMDNGFYPISKPNSHKSKDGHVIYILNVSELDYDQRGEPTPGAGVYNGYAYKQPKMIIQKSNDELKILKNPKRDSANINISSNNNNNSQQQPGNQPTP